MAFREKIKPVSVDDFFILNSGKNSYEEFAEKVYIMIHTYYITAEGKIKVELGKAWDRDFGVCMTDETFEYMLLNEPIMLRDVIVNQTRNKQEIKSSKYLEKSIVAFEFDLWMIENFKKGNALNLTDFDKYIHSKYGSFLDDRYRAFKKFDLKHINSFEGLARGLENYYSEISALFELIISNNKMRINFEKEATSRTEIVAAKHEDNNKTNVKPSVEETKKSTEAEKTVAPSSVDTKQLREEIKKEVEKEYKLILKDRDDCIESLKKDISEFKRQRDEAREYSANQYDRGVKDLFASLNDARYGKVIDYLFNLLREGNIEDNLASYLDNLFMALEDMEIEPVADADALSVKEETMLKEFNLDFNKAEFTAEKVKLKYAGWMYKEGIMEKPTITLKED